MYLDIHYIHEEVGHFVTEDDQRARFFSNFSENISDRRLIINNQALVNTQRMD